MKKLLAFIILYLLCSTYALAESPFPDVPEYHEYANEINFVKTENIIDGYSDGNYRPDNGITRSELTKIVINSKYSQSTINNCIKGASNIYPDVTNKHIFAKYICMAKRNDVVQGFSDGNFKPDEFVTFGQAAKIIIRALDDVDIEADAELNFYIARLDEKNAHPTRLTNSEILINRGETAYLVQMVMEKYEPLPAEPEAPFSGYLTQSVETDEGAFTVKAIAADPLTTKVIVDTASSSDCTDNCPVKSLDQYITDNNAYAGVNGTYFCPADAPSCAGKVNSFHLTLMNKNKVYFNSNAGYASPDPAVIFGENYFKFTEHISELGRNTDINSMLSNYPLLLFRQQIMFNSDGDPKKEIKSNRSFVASKGNTIFIGVAYNVTVPQSAKVMQAMGMDYAINLDAGGSTALWYEGYKAGPGRGIPNVILFVHK